MLRPLSVRVHERQRLSPNPNYVSPERRKETKVNYTHQRLKPLTVVRQWRVLPLAGGEPAQHHQLFGRIAGSAVRVKMMFRRCTVANTGDEPFPEPGVSQSRRHTRNTR